MFFASDHGWPLRPIDRSCVRSRTREGHAETETGSYQEVCGFLFRRERRGSCYSRGRFWRRDTHEKVSWDYGIKVLARALNPFHYPTFAYLPLVPEVMLPLPCRKPSPRSAGRCQIRRGFPTLSHSFWNPAGKRPRWTTLIIEEQKWQRRLLHQHLPHTIFYRSVCVQMATKGPSVEILLPPPQTRLPPSDFTIFGKQLPAGGTRFASTMLLRSSSCKSWSASARFPLAVVIHWRPVQKRTREFMAYTSTMTMLMSMTGPGNFYRCQGFPQNGSTN